MLASLSHAPRRAALLAACFPLSSGLFAQEQQLVLPVGMETLEGFNANRYPFGDEQVVRYQQVYGESVLQPILGEDIVEIAFRVDGISEAPPAGFQYGNVRLTLSTGAGLVDALSTAALDDNVGPDATVVFDGPYVVPPLGTGASPNSFDFRFVLPTTFSYLGGDLLLDVVVDAPVPDFWYLDTQHAVYDAVSRAWHDADEIAQDSRGLVTEFTTLASPSAVSPMVDCGGNLGSLAHVSGVPAPGAVLSLAMDDGQAPGVAGYLGISVHSAPGWPPCGLSLGGLGELLIDPTAPTPVTVLGGSAMWSGAPLVFTYPLPDDLSLIGVQMFQQGIWVDVMGLAPSEPLRLTGGVMFDIGS